jgi:pSer/pThr/pTyr-binding forkhead associated (FHA) protein
MIWVEVLSRHHDVVARFRCGDEARIGRAYDNDVVLDDPYVAPHHVRIARDESGALQAEDLGSVNGLHVADSDARVTTVALDGQRILRVGRTLLRVRAPEFAVPPERKAVPVARTWPMIAVLSVVVIGLSLLTLWLNETREMQPSRYFLPVLGVVLVVLVWTTGWTVLSRIFTGIAHFDRHLLIALGGLLAFFLFDELSDYGAFAFSSRGLADYAYVGNWILFAALCFVHLRAMGPRRAAVKGGAVAALAVAAIAAQTLSRSDDSSLVGQQSYLEGLKPPMFRLKRAQSLDGFFGETQRIKDALDKARLEPPTSRGWFDNEPDSDTD